MAQKMVHGLGGGKRGSCCDGPVTGPTSDSAVDSQISWRSAQDFLPCAQLAFNRQKYYICALRGPPWASQCTDFCVAPDPAVRELQPPELCPRVSRCCWLCWEGATSVTSG